MNGVALIELDPVARIVNDLRKKLPYTRGPLTIHGITHDRKNRRVTFHMQEGREHTFSDILLVIAKGD